MTLIEQLERADGPDRELAIEWRGMGTARRDGSEVLLLLGETIPDHADARVGSFISGNEADELGYREYAKYGAWMIWNEDGDWFCVDESAAIGWLPLPTSMPTKHRVIDNVTIAALRARSQGGE